MIVRLVAIDGNAKAAFSLTKDDSRYQDTGNFRHILILLTVLELLRVILNRGLGRGMSALVRDGCSRGG